MTDGPRILIAVAPSHRGAVGDAIAAALPDATAIVAATDRDGDWIAEAGSASLAVIDAGAGDAGRTAERLAAVLERAPHVPVVVIDPRATHDRAVRALRAGAAHYVALSDLPDALVRALTDVLADGPVVSRPAPGPRRPATDVARQEDEIARLRQDLDRRAAEIETLLEVIPIGIGIAEDPDCTRIRVNRAFASQLGIARDRNASLSAPAQERPPFRVLRGGCDVPPHELPMQTAAATGVDVHDVELDVIQPDGRRVTLYEFASPLFDERGRVRGSIGAFLDITERKRAEERARFLGLAGIALAESLDVETTLSALARILVPALADWCVIDLVQPDGTVKRRGGIHADAGLCGVVRDIDVLLPYRHDLVVPRVLKAGRSEVFPTYDRGRLAGRAPARETAALDQLGVGSYMAVPLLSKGRTIGALSLVSARPHRYGPDDVSLAEELAVRFAMALDNALLYEEARAANRLKDEFLATVSHELRTPLNAMLGWTRLLRTGSLAPETVIRALEIIERNTIAQTVLINDLLDVARVASGKLFLSVGPADVHATVLAAIDAVRPAAAARSIDIEARLDSNATHLVADADRIRQVVWNLVSNAVKFSPEGGRVEVLVRLADAGIELIVRDHGSGIAPEFLPHIFERFRQADSSTTRQHGGLGLGLSIVRHLVELHGGLVRAESPGVGQGATFTVVLPLHARPQGPVTRRRADVSPPRARVPLQTPLAACRILAVDDQADHLELIAATLQTAGAQVRAVGTATEAMEALEAFRPDVLVADIGLVGEDGYSLMRRIRDLGPAEGGRLPAIALTAYARAEDRRQALICGFDVHLPKPVDPDALRAAVSSLLQSRPTPEPGVM
jgi:PAS domain S-box-containing protein